jgi:Ca2+/Na+ antiporter
MKEQKLIYKPYSKGKVFTPQVYKKALRIFLLTIIMVVFFLFTGQLIVMTGGMLRIILSLLLLGLAMALFYYEGAAQGEDDVSLGEIVYSKQQQQQAISKDDLDNAYNPLKGFATAFLGVLPFFVLALIFAFIAQKQVYQLGGLPSWLAAFDRYRNIEIALSYYKETSALGAEGILRIIIRVLLFPFIHFFGADNPDSMLLMERISPLLILVVPSAYAMGYLNGPKRRAAVHGDIAIGKKKKANKAKRERLKRQKQKNGENNLV